MTLECVRLCVFANTVQDCFKMARAKKSDTPRSHWAKHIPSPFLTQHTGKNYIPPLQKGIRVSTFLICERNGKQLYTPPPPPGPRSPSVSLLVSPSTSVNKNSKQKEEMGRKVLFPLFEIGFTIPTTLTLAGFFPCYICVSHVSLS